MQKPFLERRDPPWFIRGWQLSALPKVPYCIGMGSAKIQGWKMVPLEVPESWALALGAEMWLAITLKSSIPELSEGKEERGTLSLWFISLHGRFGASPDVCTQSCLSGFASRLMRLSFTENRFLNTLATGQTPQRNFIFRRALKVFPLQYHQSLWPPETPLTISLWRH